MCYRNVHLLHQGPHGPDVVPGDELHRAERQPGGQYAVAVPLFFNTFLVFIKTLAHPPETKNSPNFP
jgi:hypothetical protein